MSYVSYNLDNYFDRKRGKRTVFLYRNTIRRFLLLFPLSVITLFIIDRVSIQSLSVLINHAFLMFVIILLLLLVLYSGFNSVTVYEKMIIKRNMFIQTGIYFEDLDTIEFLEKGIKLTSYEADIFLNSNFYNDFYELERMLKEKAGLYNVEMVNKC
jgi:hypothetical protein